jgi:hypothetical protein
VCWASPVCRCAASCSATFAQWTVGASRHPAFPAPSAFLRAKNTAKLGRDVPRGGEDVSTIQKRVGGEQRMLLAPSLRAQRSDPEYLRGETLDCFVTRAPRNDDRDSECRSRRSITPPASSLRTRAGRHRTPASPGNDRSAPPSSAPGRISRAEAVVRWDRPSASANGSP